MFFIFLLIAVITGIVAFFFCAKRKNYELKFK